MPALLIECQHVAVLSVRREPAPFEALFIQPQSCCVTSLQAPLIPTYSLVKVPVTVTWLRRRRVGGGGRLGIQASQLRKLQCAPAHSGQNKRRKLQCALAHSGFRARWLSAFVCSLGVAYTCCLCSFGPPFVRSTLLALARGLLASKKPQYSKAR